MLMASDVKFADPMKRTYKQYGDQAQTNLADALGGLQGQAGASALGSGRIRGNYTGQALGRANVLASQGIDNALGAQLGQASLEDTIKQQEHDRNFALAKRIGSLNAPNNLMMALQAAKGAANIYGAYKGAGGGKSQFPNPYQSYTPGTINYNRNPQIAETYYD